MYRQENSAQQANTLKSKKIIKGTLKVQHLSGEAREKRMRTLPSPLPDFYTIWISQNQNQGTCMRCMRV
uniref:Uncharacterized protein n=1 Tax=Anguilla anguilla TaxID=7936 RepID=A0A0E9TX11_ANGAN